MVDAKFVRLIKLQNVMTTIMSCLMENKMPDGHLSEFVFEYTREDANAGGGASKQEC